MGFHSLQHSGAGRSTDRRRCRRPLCSAFRVWPPSWRLTPSEPVPVLFHTGGALGIHPSELSPPGRYPPRFRAEEPTYRSTRRCSRRRSDGPAQRAPVSGLSPFQESLATGHRISAPITGCSLGFRPLRVSRQDALSRISPGLLPRASQMPTLRPALAGASESQSASALPCPRRTANRAPGSGNPFRVLAPE
jgi:hypothetical protein